LDRPAAKAWRPRGLVARATPMLSRGRSLKAAALGQGCTSCSIRAEEGAVDARFTAHATWALVGRRKGEERPRRDARRGNYRSSGPHSLPPLPSLGPNAEVRAASGFEPRQVSPARREAGFSFRSAERRVRPAACYRGGRAFPRGRVAMFNCQRRGRGTSLNVKRGNLTAGQRAIAAAEAEGRTASRGDLRRGQPVLVTRFADRCAGGFRSASGSVWHRSRSRARPRH
jgi:hypothetical protein